jgi:hypothetical protein
MKWMVESARAGIKAWDAREAHCSVENQVNIGANFIPKIEKQIFAARSRQRETASTETTDLPSAAAAPAARMATFASFGRSHPTSWMSC